jgi:hypothetical protein
MLFAKDQDVIQAVAAERPDQTLNIEEELDQTRLSCDYIDKYEIPFVKLQERRKTITRLLTLSLTA